MKNRRFILLALSLAAFSALLTGQTDWRHKIDPSVLQRTNAGETTDFLILLTEQADVNEARFEPQKSKKGRLVFQKLVETAERTQGDILKLLQDDRVPHQSFWIINAVLVQGDKSLLEKLAPLPEVREIQSNPLLKMQEPARESTTGERSIEWNITGINADDVWTMGYTGSGAVVGGQDTGYDWDHIALKLKYRGWNNTTMTADHNYNWHDAIHKDTLTTNPCGIDLLVPCDDDSHGTHTMGTMVGDDGLGNQIGVAPGAKWMGCRNMDQGYGKPSTYLECFQWFLAPTDLANQNADPLLAPDVINNSWYCPASEGCNAVNYSTMETAVNNLRSAGVVVVVSAGNSGSDCSTINNPPAIFPATFSVGASDASDVIADFSSRGPVAYNGQTYIKPDITAPGKGVRSSIPNDGYGSKSGTSMAGPHVAGVVALIISANPSLAGNVTQIENILESTARNKTTTQDCGSTPGTSIPNNTYGYGIIDAKAAIEKALTILPVELMSFSGVLERSGVRLSWRVALPGSLHHFEVEYTESSSSLNWKVIGKIPFSPDEENYTIFHETKGSGVTYYRLKMVDIDGQFSYSKIISFNLTSRLELTVFPNPVTTGKMNLSGWDVADEPLTFRVFDVMGRCVMFLTKIQKQPILTLDVSTLIDGVYYVNIFYKDGRYPSLQGRFIKRG
jgi:subtilisin family serine protease